MGKIIGIDLGTTNSCVAVVENGEPVVIPNAEGSRTTPSMVSFNDKGERLVGQVAKRQAVTNPERTIFAVKRLIGRKFDSPEVKRSIELSPFQIVPSKNKDAWVKINDKEYSPPEISAMILFKMKETAEEYLGEEVTQAVITVPAYFDDSQRQATKDAGKIAGLKVERIINEPTAASLAYGLEKKQTGKIAVFDLGGGTFDISILELKEGVFHVLATNGDTFLGGEDFDQAIVDYLVEEFQKETGIDLKKDKMALQRLKEAAEKAKHELSSTMETDVSLPFITADESGPKHLNIQLTRSKLEELTEEIIDRLEAPCKTALQDAGISESEIDEIILVGGQTRMPAVQKKVTEIFGKEPYKGINPDEVVAMGAAIQGAVISGDVDEVLLLDVTPLSLGVETKGGVFTKIIEKNTTIPVRKKQVFSTSVDNQSFVSIHVLQGERELAKDNKSLAKFDLVGIPPAPRGVPQIEVSFDIDTNGILSVSAKDLGTGRAQSIKITPSSGLTQEEIERMVKEAEEYKQQDMQNKELVDACNELEGLVYNAERTLKEMNEMLEEEDKNMLDEAIKKAKEVIENPSMETVLEAHNHLNEVTHKIAENIYSAVDDETEQSTDDEENE